MTHEIIYVIISIVKTLDMHPTSGDFKLSFMCSDAKEYYYFKNNFNMGGHVIFLLSHSIGR